MTEQEKASLADDNLQGHDSGLINEKFNDKPIEPEHKEGEPEAGIIKPPLPGLQAENGTQLQSGQNAAGKTLPSDQLN